MQNMLLLLPVNNEEEDAAGTGGGGDGNDISVDDLRSDKCSNFDDLEREGGAYPTGRSL
jgi:hypothetical protein